MKNIRKITVLLLIVLCLFTLPVKVQASTEKDISKSFKNTKKITELVKELNDWSGFQYIYLLKSKEKKNIALTEYNMLNIAALDYYEPDLGDYKSATKEGILRRTDLLFGKKPSLDSLNTYEEDKASVSMDKHHEFICKLKNGGLTTLYGDWGEYYPDMELLGVYSGKDETYKVRVKNYFVECETNKKNDYGITTFTVKKSSNTKYGYIITGIKLQKDKIVKK